VPHFEEAQSAVSKDELVEDEVKNSCFFSGLLERLRKSVKRFSDKTHVKK